MTKEQEAVKLLDEIITLFKLADEDYNVIDRALKLIADTSDSDPDFPVTVSLMTALRKKGLVHRVRPSFTTDVIPLCRYEVPGPSCGKEILQDSLASSAETTNVPAVKHEKE